MNTTEIARDFVKMLIEEYPEGYQAYWSEDIVSIEPREGPAARVQGRAALLEKHAWWAANSQSHSTTVDGTYVIGDQFTVRFTSDVTLNGERLQFTEIGLYTLEDGKIIEEKFFAAADEW